MRIFRFTIGFLLLLTFSCSQAETARNSKKYKTLREGNPATAKGQKLLADQNESETGAVRRLYQLFELERFVLLEETGEHFLKDVSQAFFFESFWFVCDTFTDKVYQYHADGSFLRQVGANGEGPGEYNHVFGAKPLFDGRIAVAMRGKILVYDVDGTTLSTVNSQSLDTHFGSTFIWAKPDLLILADTPSLDWNSPQHSAYRMEGDKGSLLFGFGVRPEFTNRKDFRESAYEAMAKIGDNLWIGSPYSHKISIFDAKGTLLKEVWAPHIDAMTLEDNEGVDFKNRKSRSNYYSKRRNHGIFRVGDLVIVSLAGRIPALIFDVYDLDGNLLYWNLHSGLNFPWLQSSYDGFLVATFPVSPEHPNFGNNIFPFELEALKEAGLEGNSDQKFLWLGKLRKSLPTASPP